MRADTALNLPLTETTRPALIGHLLAGNLARDRTPEELARSLIGLARLPGWPHAALVASIARRFVARLGVGLDANARAALAAAPGHPKLEDASDRLVVAAAIRLGEGLGIAAAWGVSVEADVLRAAAAHLLRHETPAGTGGETA